MVESGICGADSGVDGGDGVIGWSGVDGRGMRGGVCGGKRVDVKLQCLPLRFGMRHIPQLDALKFGFM